MNNRNVKLSDMVKPSGANVRVVSGRAGPVRSGHGLAPHSGPSSAATWVWANASSHGTRMPTNGPVQTFQAIMFFVVIGSAIWVGIDASHRDFSGSSFASKTWHWVVGILLLWIVVFPIYLFQRSKTTAKGVVAAGDLGQLQQPEMYSHLPALQGAYAA